MSPKELLESPNREATLFTFAYHHLVNGGESKSWPKLDNSTDSWDVSLSVTEKESELALGRMDTLQKAIEKQFRPWRSSFYRDWQTELADS